MSPQSKSTSNVEGTSEANGATTPLWLLMLLAVLLYASMLYFDRRGGDFQANVYAPFRNLEDLAKYQPIERMSPGYKHGEQLYGMTCSACHQATGVGAPGQCPPLVGSDWVLQKDPARIIRLVQLGGGGPIKVAGVEYTPAVVMPPLGSAFPNDQDLADVLTYVRQTWGNKAPDVTAAQVKKVRAEIADRKDSWTSAELLKVPVTE